MDDPKRLANLHRINDTKRMASIFERDFKGATTRSLERFLNKVLGSCFEVMLVRIAAS